MPSYLVFVDGPGEQEIDVKPENEVLYVTLMADLIDTFEGKYGDDSWETRLDVAQQEELFEAARDYMANFNGGWGDALSDAIESVMIPNGGFPTDPEDEDDGPWRDGVRVGVLS